MSSSNTKPCACCSKHNVSQVCAGCNDAPDPTKAGLVKTLYCDVTCQKAHWEAHKNACKAHRMRKILYRAGETAQMAFYAYRENTFDLLIDRVEKHGKGLLIFEGSYGTTQECFFSFPDHLLPDERDKQAVLTYLTCGDSVGYMHELFKTMLDGIYSNILELELTTKPYERKVTLIPLNDLSNTLPFSHAIIRVLLKSGEIYALDIAGAQHGHHDPVCPWDQYEKSRILAIRERIVFGATQTWLLSDEVCLASTVAGGIRRSHKTLVACFNDIRKVCEKKNLMLGEMIKLPDEKFRNLRVDLVSTIREDMRCFEEWVQANGKKVPLALTT